MFTTVTKVFFHFLWGSVDPSPATTPTNWRHCPWSAAAVDVLTRRWFD